MSSPTIFPVLTQMIGVRFVRASEPDGLERTQELLIKDLTDGQVMWFVPICQASHTDQAAPASDCAAPEPPSAPTYPDWIDSHPVSAETARAFVSKGLGGVKDWTMWRLRRDWWDLLDAASTPEERLTCQRMIDALGEDIGRRKAARGV